MPIQYVTLSKNGGGIHLKNLCVRGTQGCKSQYSKKYKLAKKFFFYTKFGNWVYRTLSRLVEGKILAKNFEESFITDEDNFYYGHTFKFMYKNEGIELIEEQLRKDFSFKNISLKNIEYSEYLKSINSVCIHARRGDFLANNNDCYKYGYFKRATKYIKRKVKNPIFIFFCDPGTLEWVKQNLKIFGLNTKDKIEFVDWNKEEKNYEDLYLMSQCKHNIITKSSFGWWGAFLNNNPNKITISPDCRINTTNWL